MDVRQAFPAMRIFVFGQEVSEDVQSCTMTISDNTRAPNTASFVLANRPTGVRSEQDGGAIRRYTVEHEDMFRLYPKLQGITLSTGYDDAAVEDALNQLRRDVALSVSEIPDRVKRRVLTAKSGKTALITVPTGPGYETTVDSVASAAALRGEAPLWTFWQGRPIFHSNDPVRIFVRDLFDPSVWYYAFSGFISDWSVQKGVDGEEHIRFTCEDVLRIFRYARVSTSPGLFDIDALQEAEDFVVQTFFGSDFTNLTLNELVSLLVFGPNTEYLSRYVESGNIDVTAAEQIGTKNNKKYTRYAANGDSTTKEVPFFGIGAFRQSTSHTFEFGPGGNIDLETYQTLVSSKVTTADLPRMIVEGEIWPSLTRVEDVITEIGENPQLYPVDGGSVFILAPTTLGAASNRDIIDRGFKGPETQTSWKSRLGILYDVFNRLEFSFYATPRGDVVAEMPLYDFDPKHFGTHASDLIVPSRDIITTEQSFTDERVRTMVTSTFLAIKGHTDLGVAQRVAGETPAVARRRTLVPQFGVRVEERNPEVYVSSRSGAEVYAELQLNKINADALTNSLQMTPRMMLLPNRPLMVPSEAYIAAIRSTSVTIDWVGLNVSHNVALNYSRPWQGQYEDGEMVYKMLGDGGRVMNYAALFKE